MWRLNVLHLLHILSTHPTLILSCTEIALIQACKRALIFSERVDSRSLILMSKVCCSVRLPELFLGVSICCKSSITWFNSHRSFCYFGSTYWWDRVFSCGVSIVFYHLYSIRSNPLFYLLDFLLAYISDRVTMTSLFLRVLIYTFVWPEIGYHSCLICHLAPLGLIDWLTSVASNCLNCWAW